MSVALVSNPDEKYKCASCDSNFKEPEGTDHLRGFGYIILFFALLASLFAYLYLSGEVKSYNQYSDMYSTYAFKTDEDLMREPPGDDRIWHFAFRKMCREKGPPVPVNEAPYTTTFVISAFMGLWAVIMLVISATRPPRCPNCKSHNYNKI